MSHLAGIHGFRAAQLWQPGGWQAAATFGVDAGGRLLAAVAAPVESLGTWVLPGMPNLHSHAFQRAMAGLAERRGSAHARLPERRDSKAAPSGRAAAQSDDNFWSWRETMYAFAAAIGPDELQAIAAQLYVEMLKAGYTQVCEFHYLHHQPDGTPYSQPEAMSLALIAAAREAGIALTLLPVLYISGGFDGRALSPRQRRFGHDVDGYLRLLQSLRRLESDDLRVGIALHSLRAVPEAAMREVLAGDAAKNCPIHIHVAEQIGEVQDCLATRGARPVEWLFAHADVDHSWCLVHATHLTAGETTLLARSGAVAGLCPTTEANLGDGLFPLADYLDAGGALGIGSDSHISISPVEELRWLEYGQRLQTRHRNIAARAQDASVGETLWRAALHGGAQASGMPVGEVRAGARADLIVLDETSPLLAARDARSLLDSFLFAGNTPLVRDVLCGGRWVVRDFHHHDEARIAARYRQTVQRLAGSA
ncbi:MAG: formimidoylglutamate deiminase [Xanthomonadaceae bacterium]|nr:formimidoylglutamate deiminase [Xanthomonadaceae bacterium]